MADDLPARLLRPVRHRAAIAYASPRACSESQRDVPRLLAAVDAVLKLVHDARPGMTDCICADCETSRGNGFSGIHRPRPGALVDAIAVLEAITRELTGEEKSGGKDEMTSFRLPGDMVAALRERAAQRGESPSDVLREAALLLLGQCPTCGRPSPGETGSGEEAGGDGG